MNKALAFGAGLGLGTGLMYLLDPDRGRRRRALLRDKGLWAARKTGDCLEVTARDLRNRSQGIISELQSRFSSEPVDDSILVGRVRRDALGAGLGAAGLLLLTRGITNADFMHLTGLGSGQGEGQQQLTVH